MIHKSIKAERITRILAGRCINDAIIVAVAHDQFKAMGAPPLRTLGKAQHVLYDLKYALPAAESDLRL